MARFVILNHYVEGNLVGVWVEQIAAPPICHYSRPGYEDVGRSIVIGDKPEGATWADHMLAVASRTPTTNWFVDDYVDAPDSPDIEMVVELMRAEDERLHSR